MTVAIVDIHSHLYPRSYIEMLRARETIPRVVGNPGNERFVIFPGEEGRPMGPDHWSVSEKLAFMDRVGIAQTVLSLGNPWLDPFDGPESADMARRLNEEFGELEPNTGGRIVGMGVLPHDTVGSAVGVAGEIAEANTLHGVVSGPRVCGRLLDDEELDPLWQMLEETQLPFFLHPHYAVGGREMAGYGHVFPVAMGFPFETTIAVARLIFGGVLRRFPRLRVVASHGGGTIPYLAGRLDAAWRSDPSVHDRLSSPPTEDLARIFLDAVLYHPLAMRAAATLVGASRMSFGTDHPFSVSDPEANLSAIRQAFEDEDRDRVLGTSARSLFGLPTPDR